MQGHSSVGPPLPDRARHSRAGNHDDAAEAMDGRDIFWRRNQRHLWSARHGRALTLPLRLCETQLPSRRVRSRRSGRIAAAVVRVGPSPRHRRGQRAIGGSLDVKGKAPCARCGIGVPFGEYRCCGVCGQRVRKECRSETGEKRGELEARPGTFCELLCRRRDAAAQHALIAVLQHCLLLLP